MKTTTEKKFDCVKSVRKERKRIAADTEGLSASETLEYFQKRKKNSPKKSDGG
ncbi:MAG: hypothetical protein WD059_12035 [Balneolaceae bacterium]